MKRRNFVKFALSGISAAAIAACRPRSQDYLEDPHLGDEAEGNAEPGTDNTQRVLGQVGPSDYQATDPDTVIKKNARSDYALGLQKFGGRLANAPSALKSTYDVLVIGSGYGGAIAAARLSQHLRTGKTLAILERGKEWVSGDFPDTLSSFRKHLRTKDQPHGLYDVSFHDDIVVLQGSGLGGTSLINANVVARPRAEVFNHSTWPAVMRNGELLKPYFAKVEATLAATPTSVTSSGKAKTHQLSSAKLPQTKFRMLPLAVQSTGNGYQANFKNPAGMYQRQCTMCGDCITGCNVGAKNTLPYNYLALAKNAGAEIFTEIEVDYIEQTPNQEYIVHAVRKKEPSWPGKLFNAVSTEKIEVRAKIVVLGAGALGTTGILLRSKEKKKLAMCDQVGARFGANGDYFVAGRGVDPQKGATDLDIAGKGAYVAQNNIGPMIQSEARVTNVSEPSRDLTIQDLSIPRALIPVLKFLTGSMKEAMFYLGIGNDGSEGRIEIDRSGSPKIVWPEIKQKPIFALLRSEAARHVSVLNAKSSKLLEWGEQRKLITAHPLGGCVMGDSAATGAVNENGQLYRNNNNALHEGLFVTDASIIPTGLAINPLLTISALAELISERIVRNPQYKQIFRDYTA